MSNQVLTNSQSFLLSDQSRPPATVTPGQKTSQPLISRYFHALWGGSRYASGTRSPVPLLTRPTTPEQAPLLNNGESDDTPGQTNQQQRAREPNQAPSSSCSSSRSSKSSRFLGHALLALFIMAAMAASPLLTRYFWRGLRSDQYCINSLVFAYGELTFATHVSDNEKTYWGDVCQNPLRVTSLIGAAKTYCPPSEIMSGFDVVRTDCMQRAELELLDVEALLANLTEHEISSWQVVDIYEIPRDVQLSEPVLLSPGYFEHVFSAVDTWYFELWTHHTYGFALYGFWAGVILLGIASNCWITWTSRQRGRRLWLIHDEEEGQRDRRFSESHGLLLAPFHWLVHQIRTHILVPATLGTYHQRLFYWCTIPSRAETIVVSSFWVLSTVLACINYKTYPDNYFWAETDMQLWRYISDRTGVMSYASLTLVWVFAARNNGFLWATGWSYRTFNIYHRHVARVGTLLGIVHSFGYSYLYIVDSGWSGYWIAMGKSWLLLGIMATFAMTALLVFSHAWVRVKFYESFLAIHIALSVVTLIGLFTHTAQFENYDNYLWPAVVIWCSDRILRLARIVNYKFRAKLSGDVVRGSRSRVAYNPQSDVIRLEIWPANKQVKPDPGVYYYIYQPSTWRGYENHPFTLGAWSSTIADGATNSRSVFGGKEPESVDTQVSATNSLTSSPESSQTHLLTPYQTSESYQSSSLIFWVRPYDGWTKRLRDECLRSPAGVAHPSLLLEGPYGHSAPSHTYDTILLLAGGTGIASAVPYILDHITRSSNHQSRTRTTKIHLVWTARQKAFIEDVCNEELASALGRDDLNVSFYATQPPSDVETSVLFEDLPSPMSPLLQNMSRSKRRESIEIAHHRPDIRSVVLRTAREEDIVAARTAVLVCGPAGMADEARAAVHEAMRAGCRGLDYFEEAFGW